MLWVEPDTQGASSGGEAPVVLMGIVSGDSECGVAVGAPLRLGRVGVERPVHVEEQQRSVHGSPRVLLTVDCPQQRNCGIVSALGRSE